MLPLLVVNVVVILFPAMSALYYSFTDWTGIGTGANFTGLTNYFALVRDPEFSNALVHNVEWTLFFLIVPMALGLVGAFLLSRIKRFQVLFRVLYFIPYIIATVVNAAIWESILDANSGFGALVGHNFLGSQGTALLSVAFANNWSWWGFLLVIFLAAMQGVNPALYEAAELDGAGPVRQFVSITLPNIRSVFAFLGLMTIIWSFLSFDYVYIMTQGGPAGSTDVLSTLLYRNAFMNLQSGYASAIGVTLALITAAVVAFYLIIRRVRQWEI